MQPRSGLLRVAISLPSASASPTRCPPATSWRAEAIGPNVQHTRRTGSG